MIRQNRRTSRVYTTGPGCGLLIFKAVVVTILTLIEVFVLPFFIGQPEGWDIFLLASINWTAVTVTAS